MEGGVHNTVQNTETAQKARELNPVPKISCSKYCFVKYIYTQTASVKPPRSQLEDM